MRSSSAGICSVRTPRSEKSLTTPPKPSAFSLATSSLALGRRDIVPSSIDSERRKSNSSPIGIMRSFLPGRIPSSSSSCPPASRALSRIWVMPSGSLGQLDSAL